MKFTLSWLKQHLNTDKTAAELGQILTSIGLEIEEIKDPAAAFAPFKVAYVESAEKHPDADKLRVCMVKTADHGTIQVVCGAPNARSGMKGVFAPSGTYIPGLDVTLKKANIRGVESNGMLVSEREMCLSDEHNGIIEVDAKYEIGTPMAEIFGLDDPVFEISLTPNRGDCAGIRGIARDLAAAGAGTLIAQDESAVKGAFKSPIGVKIENTDGCPHFLGRYIRGVKNSPSPDWLQKQLKAVGLRPISALVDITNYMTLGQNRPLHVFDADKLKGGIKVGAAKGGETLAALNDKTYTLGGGEVTIEDESGVIGLGGIVGGVSTGCEEDTVNVFLEAAYFNPMRTSRTGRDHGIESDARYRFERGIDPEFTAAGLEIATRLVIELCGTDKTQVSEVVEAGNKPEWKRSINFDPAYTALLSGMDVAESEQVKILTALGFVCSKKGSAYNVTPPSWRGDIEARADLVEEIVRIKGFDNIPALSVTADQTRTSGVETQNVDRARKARAALAARGLQECVTWSFMGKALAALFGSNDNAALSLSNPISSELDQMRPSILPNLIEAAQRNADRGFPDNALFEIGPVFTSSKMDGQQFVAAGVRGGNAAPRHWSDKNANRPLDAFDAKADIYALLEACGAPSDSVPVSRDAPDYYHPGRSGTLRLGPNVLAHFGEIHPAILAEMDIKFPLCAFEVFLQNIPAPRKKSGTAKPMVKLAPLQPVSRDFAFLVDMKVEADSLLRAAKAADKNLITDAAIFDVYTGKGVDEGKKSVALSVQIQPQDHSLTDKELEALAQKIADNVMGKTGGVLRG